MAQRTRRRQRLFIHAFTDGRDTLAHGGRGLRRGASRRSCARRAWVRIATVSGRYYAMDRDRRWDRVKLAYDALVHGAGPPGRRTRVTAIAESYARGETDEFILPTIVGDDPASRIRDGDGVDLLQLPARPGSRAVGGADAGRRSMGSTAAVRLPRSTSWA